MTPTTAEQREHILRCLRQATAYQIGLWDTASKLAGLVGCELQEVLDAIMHISITADFGMELGADDLRTFLNRRLSRTKIGAPLAEERIQ